MVRPPVPDRRHSPNPSRFPSGDAFVSESELRNFPAALHIAREILLKDSPSAFASLALLVSLRAGDCGAYVHPGLMFLLGDDLLQSTLATLHNETFDGWLAVPLGDQRTAVEAYLGPTSYAPVTSPSVASFALYLPQSAERSRRGIFEADLDLLLTVLRVKHGIAAAPLLISGRLPAALDRVTRASHRQRAAVRSIAGMLGVSPNYLGHVFRDHAGIPLHHYLLAAKMFAAADMARRAPTSVKALAAMLDYSDLSNFLRDFHRFFHLSPASYRALSVGTAQ